MDEHDVNDNPRIHLLSGILAGGAANGATHLQHALRKAGVNSSLHYPAKLKVGSEIRQLQQDGCQPLTWNIGGLDKLKQKISHRVDRQIFKRKIRGRDPGQEIFTSPRGAPHTPWPPAHVEPQSNDIIHLHWVAKFIDYTSFFQSLPKNQPVIWTLHDMNPFTGGCHFTEGCEQFVQHCGNCPQLPNCGPDDISRHAFSTKMQALRDVNLHVVTVSHWMTEQSKKSPIFEQAQAFHHIPYGLAMDVFKPVNKNEAREQLGIDKEAFVFSFGAADIRNRRKGLAPLLKSLEVISDFPNTLGMMFGGGDIPNVEHALPELRMMGFIRDVKQMVLIHSACDVFVMPSLEDNLPFTCLEALATGIPVVGFDAGGVPDMVRPGVTGWLVPAGDSLAMGKQLKYVAEHRDEAARLGQQAREVAVQEYSEEREVIDYKKLYKEVLQQPSKR
ncbi:MAG: hypothetical protein CBE43_07520 [Rhodopirellula sp. TMED283]|nr:MAG: hypothetical protein CBE43_07520 [Rhodopirellula sp. TMED283]